jgi:hypothetical protein
MVVEEYTSLRKVGVLAMVMGRQQRAQGIGHRAKDTGHRAQGLTRLRA